MFVPDPWPSSSVYTLFTAMPRRPTSSTLFPYTTLFRSRSHDDIVAAREEWMAHSARFGEVDGYRSEEHTSELQSRRGLVCRLLLEKKARRSCAAPPSSFGPASRARAAGCVGRQCTWALR